VKPPTAAEIVFGDLPVHLRILRHCARATLAADHAGRLAGLLADPSCDLEALTRAATQQGVIGLVAHHLAALERAGLPAPAGLRIREVAQHCTLRAMMLAGRMGEVAAALREAGVKAVFYKGPTLALRLYGQLALRHFGDLDVLVHPSQVEVAMAALGRIGFSMRDDCAPYLGVLRRTYSEVSLLRGDGAIRQDVDLHWHYAPWRLGYGSGFVDESLARAETFEVGAHAVLTPSLSDLLVILCMHGGTSLWNRIYMMADVAELLRKRPDLAGRETLETAERAGAGRLFRFALWLAEAFGAAVGAEMQEEIARDPAIPAMARIVRREILAPTRDGGLFNVFYWHMRDGLADRARLAWRLVANPTLVDHQILGSRGLRFPPLAYSLHMLRPFRLVPALLRGWRPRA
jgi:hypothetical protein